MFFNLLEKLGRKKIVLDRGPSHPEFYNAKPWMERYYLLFKQRPKWLPKECLFCIKKINSYQNIKHT